MSDKKQTDDKLHEDLTAGGWKKEEENKYSSSTSHFDVVETDGDWYRINGGPWMKR